MQVHWPPCTHGGPESIEQLQLNPYGLQIHVWRAAADYGMGQAMQHISLPHQTQGEHSCTVFNRIYKAALQQIAGRLKTQLILSSCLVTPTRTVSESLQSLQGTQTFRAHSVYYWWTVLEKCLQKLRSSFVLNHLFKRNIHLNNFNLRSAGI